MPLGVTMNMNANKIMTALGFSYGTIMAAQNSGVTMEVKSSEIIVSKGVDNVAVEVGGQILLALKQGKIGPTQKAFLKNNLEAALSSLTGAPHMDPDPEVMPFDTDPATLKPKKGALGLLKDLPKVPVEQFGEKTPFEIAKEADKKYAMGDTMALEAMLLKEQVQSGAMPVSLDAMVFPLKEMKKAPCIKLRDANALYQPVHGTDSGSRYYVVGVSKNLRVAARLLMSGKLSVRVEGPNFAQCLANMKDAGFDVNADMGYASIHVMCPTITNARHALGALMMGLGEMYLTPTPSVEVLKA